MLDGCGCLRVDGDGAARDGLGGRTSVIRMEEPAYAEGHVAAYGPIATVLWCYRIGFTGGRQLTLGGGRFFAGELFDSSF